MRKIITVLLALVIVLSLAAPVAMATTDPTETTAASVATTDTTEGTVAAEETTAATEEAEVEAPVSNAETPTAPDTTQKVLEKSQLYMIIFIAVVAVVSLLAIVLIIVKRKSLKDKY